MARKVLVRKTGDRELRARVGRTWGRGEGNRKDERVRLERSRGEVREVEGVRLERSRGEVREDEGWG